MRLFIAIEIPEETKGYLRELQDSIKIDLIKATYPKQFHLTLLFLGDTEENKLEDIKTKLHDIKFNEFNLAFDKIGVFPNYDYMRVVWLGIKEAEQIEKLADDVSVALNQKPDKKFHPHITLARIKYITEKEQFKKILQRIKTKSISFKINSFKLIKSTLGKDGPRYEVIKEFNVRK